MSKQAGLEIGEVIGPDEADVAELKIALKALGPPDWDDGVAEFVAGYVAYWMLGPWVESLYVAPWAACGMKRRLGAIVVLILARCLAK